MDDATAMIPSTDGVTIAAYDFGGRGPDLLLCHANGLHAHVWQPVIEHLQDHYRCIAMDFRGHGRSVLSHPISYAWGGFGEDVLAVVDGLNIGSDLLVAGWSMGGCAAIMAEQNRPGLFSRLWLYEPIVFPPVEPVPIAAVHESNLSAGARRRRAVFPSRDAAFDNYAAKPPFALAEGASLRAYVEHGFADLDDGTVRLRCEPETEADIFDQSISPAWPRLGEVQPPATVIGSGDGGPPAQIAPQIAEALPAGDFEAMADLTHFGPMQDPGRIALSIRHTMEIHHD